jgi:trimeric autotransporter adhesin
MGTKNYNFQYINEPEHRRTDLVPETCKFLDQIDDALHGVSAEKGVSALESAVSGDTVTITGKDKAGATLTETEFKVSGGSADLPIASADTLGGVKIGDNLSITADGVLSATAGGSADINSIAPLKVATAPQAENADTALAIGNGAVAKNLGSSSKATAVGANAVADFDTGSGNVALGCGAAAAHYHTTAIGGGSAATNEGATALGHEAQASGAGSLVLGCGAVASAKNAIAIGESASAASEQSVIIGQYCKGPSSGYRSTIIAPNLTGAPSAAIVMTAGYIPNPALSDAQNSVILTTSGSAGGYDANSKRSVSIGNSEYSAPFRSTANYGVCIGHGAQTGSTTYADTGNVAIGSQAVTVNGSDNIKQAVAIGDNALADEDNTVSFGNKSRTPRIVRVGDPVSVTDAATKNYVDNTHGKLTVSSVTSNVAWSGLPVWTDGTNALWRSGIVKVTNSGTDAVSYDALINIFTVAKNITSTTDAPCVMVKPDGSHLGFSLHVSESSTGKEIQSDTALEIQPGTSYIMIGE